MTNYYLTDDVLRCGSVKCMASVSREYVGPEQTWQQVKDAFIETHDASCWKKKS